MASMNIRTGDLVEVIVGDENEKGKRGKILVAYPEKRKVIVEGINLVKRHVKPRNAQEKGGIIEKPRAIDVSNVMLVCPKCSKATRVGHTLAQDGKKYLRSCKKCGAVIDVKEDKTVAKKAAKSAPKKKAAAQEIAKEE
jgi:large subunit ribosomal protein L24